ncbi:MAG: ABC transporter ATP-binding protein, partial [Rhodospirillales bacterium]|nr:ABC transporter ATP-binding protein [Rhodospirillales bacterium]
IENVMVGYHLRCDGRFLPSFLRFPSVASKDREYRERAAELMAFVGLQDYIRADASAMSYGTLKRLELARALAVQPKLLLLDEPAAGLNPKETLALDGLIQRVAERGVTVVLVEHDMRLVWAVSNHILVLNHGTKLAEGTGPEVRQNPDVVAAYLGERGRNA